jgi:hypothetical protein
MDEKIVVYDNPKGGKRQLESAPVGFLDDLCTRINNSINQVYE